MIRFILKRVFFWFCLLLISLFFNLIVQWHIATMSTMYLLWTQLYSIWLPAPSSLALASVTEYSSKFIVLFCKEEESSELKTDFLFLPHAPSQLKMLSVTFMYWSQTMPVSAVNCPAQCHSCKIIVWRNNMAVVNFSCVELPFFKSSWRVTQSVSNIKVTQHQRRHWRRLSDCLILDMTIVAKCVRTFCFPFRKIGQIFSEWLRGSRRKTFGGWNSKYFLREGMVPDTELLVVS